MKKKTMRSKPAKSLKTLPAKKVNARTAKGVKGGSTKSGQAIEITDYGFGVSMPVTTK